MHRHGYKGRKFGRETDQRQALLRGLMCSLIEHKSISTTLPSAKEIRRYTERLVTLAKKGGLANRRLIISRLDSQELGSHLVDKIAPQIKRDSGYLRIKRTGFRKGDHAETATISFVDEISTTPIAPDKPKETVVKETKESTPTTKQPKGAKS